MARKILISRRDFVQDSAAVLSLGSWSLPLNNLKDYRPEVVAEATNNNWASTNFLIDLGYQRKVGLFFFINLRTTSLGRMRIQSSLVSDFSSSTYDSGLITTWPQDSVAGEYNFWNEWTLNGVYTSDEYFDLGMPRYFVPDAPVNCRYIYVEIRDSTSSDPIQIGCFGACEVWESPIDYAPAPQITILDESEISKVPMGSIYIEERMKRRRFNFGFPAMTKNEVMNRSLNLALVKGKSQPLVIVSFPDEDLSLEKTSVYGLITQDGGISNPFFGYWAQSFQVDQL